MEKAIVEHIFDPFFTTKNRRRARALGFGIIKQNNGSIFVQQVPAAIQICRSRARARRAVAAVEQATAVGRVRPFVVEDEGSLRIFASGR